jgi:hypothetical protein
VISSDQKWQRGLPADSVQLLVTVLAVKLVLANNKWSVFTNVFENIVVHVESTLVDTCSFLALTAHAENRLEL